MVISLPPPQASRIAVRLIILGALILAWAAPAFCAGSIYTDPQAWGKAFKTDKERQAPEFAFVKADPKLPNVLIIGDSISMGYTPPVREALAGAANVYRVAGNCGDTSRGLTNLNRWLGGMNWAVIYFNFGLHDLKHLNEAGKYDDNGKVVATPEKYEQNLTQFVKQLKAKAPGAKLIFASTTPVPAGTLGRVKGDEVKYNEVAVKVMRENGVPVVDLCALVTPQIGTLQRPKNVHFTPEGYKLMAGKVAGEIRKALPESSAK